MKYNAGLCERYSAVVVSVEFNLNHHSPMCSVLSKTPYYNWY